jgi:hypothetical protein
MLAARKMIVHIPHIEACSRSKPTGRIKPCPQKKTSFCENEFDTAANREVLM